MRAVQRPVPVARAEQILIELFNSVELVPPRKTVDDDVATSRTHLPCPDGILEQQRNSVSHTDIVAYIYKESVEAVANRFLYPANPSGDDRSARRHVLEDGIRKALGRRAEDANL